MLAGALLAVGAYFIYKQFAQKNAQSGGTTGGNLGGVPGTPSGSGSTGGGGAVGSLDAPIAKELQLMEAVTTSGSLNIRKERSVNAPVVGQLANGQKFYTELVLGGAGWWSVLSADKKTRRGYVSSQFTKFADEKPNTTTPSGATRNYRVAVSSGTLNIREKPDAASKIIGTLAKGATVKGSETSDPKWIKVTDSSGKVGYVSALYMSKI